MVVTSQRLAIESSRHLKPPIPALERICKYCHLRNIDDELYCITECEFHAIKQVHLYKIVQKFVPNFIDENSRDRFVDILMPPGGLLERTIFSVFKT